MAYNDRIAVSRGLVEPMTWPIPPRLQTPDATALTDCSEPVDGGRAAWCVRKAGSLPR